MRFSNPLPSRRENGRLSGSAHTRISRAPAAPANATRKQASALWKAEDIEHPALLGDVRKVAHRVHEPERRAAIALVEVARHDGARPAADARQDRDALVAVRRAIGHRLADHARGGLE